MEQTRTDTDLGTAIAGAFALRTRGIDGALLFGSAARGRQDEWSDIDLILLTGDSRRSSTALRRLVADLPGANRLQLQPMTHAAMTQLFADRPDFAAHLVSEGIVLYDKRGFLSQIMRQPIRPIHPRDFERILVRAERQGRLDRFNGQLLFSLARLYSLGKAAVILSLLRQGQPEFDRHSAFASFKESHQELAFAVDKVTRLEPFYLRVRRHATTRLPFDPSGPEGERAAMHALQSVRQIVASV